jgi:hypoxanthine phosphoribosyltransferase
MWRDAIQRVLISEAALRRRIHVLGKAITRDYHGQDLIVIPVLRGAMVFAADLVRVIDLPLTMDAVCLSSYGDQPISSGTIHLQKDLADSITGKHALIVEDIIDTGLTLQLLWRHLLAYEPARLGVCVLLDKPARRRVDVAIHYRGFEVPDAFVVGYGLDYQGRYRNLPFIGVLRPEYLQHERPPYARFSGRNARPPSWSSDGPGVHRPEVEGDSGR